jgi:uncharacterized protein YjbJ (UPF0337 family)
MHTGEG